MESSLEFVDVAGRKLPVFVKTWAIVDLVLSSLRLVIALIYGVVFLCMVLGGSVVNSLGMVMAGQAVFLPALVGITGIAAAIAILLHKSRGVLCGWICFGLTVASIVWPCIGALALLGVGSGDVDSAFLGGYVFGTFLSSGIRACLLAVYGVMLVRARRFFEAG